MIRPPVPTARINAWNPVSVAFPVLLDGEAMTIKPEGFDQIHIRGGGQHRLRENSGKMETARDRIR